MNNAYHRDIMEILLACGGNGLKLHRISKKIYNRHADLFADDVNYDALYNSVRFYLWKQSKRRESPIMRNSFGVYAIKPDAAIQLDLFWDQKHQENRDEEETHSEEDKGPQHIQMELF